MYKRNRKGTKNKIKTHCTYTRVCVFLNDFTKFLVTQFLICLFIWRCKFCFVCCSYAFFYAYFFENSFFCIRRSVCVIFILRQSWLFCGQCLFFVCVHFDMYVLVVVCFHTGRLLFTINWKFVGSFAGTRDWFRFFSKNILFTTASITCSYWHFQKLKLNSLCVAQCSFVNWSSKFLKLRFVFAR